MKATVEISLYPLREEYVPEIDDFINRMKQHVDFTLKVNATSTQISGNYDSLMQALQREIKSTFLSDGKFIFAMKVLKGDLLD